MTTPWRRSTVGEGFSQQQVIEYDLRELKAELASLLKRLASRRKLTPLLAEIEQRLAPLWDLSLAAIKQEFPAEEFPVLRVMEGSVPHYAHRILKLVASARAAIDGGDADQAARWAFSLGLLIREFELKTDFQRAAMTGGKIRAGLAEGRTRGNQGKQRKAAIGKKQWQALADVKWETHPDWDNSQVAREITKDARAGNWKTVRRMIVRPPKKVVITG